MRRDYEGTPAYTPPLTQTRIPGYSETMTVETLIAKLQKFPGKATVMSRDASGEPLPIYEVDLKEVFDEDSDDGDFHLGEDVHLEVGD